MQNYQNIDDRDFVSAIESGNIPSHSFDHMALIRLATIIYWQYGIAQGQSKISNIIQGITEKADQSEQFHATRTYAYFQVVAALLNDNPDVSSWREAQQLLAQVIDNGAEIIHQYYSEFLLNTSAARKRILPPDIKIFAKSDLFNRGYAFDQGNTPLLISMPHNGTCVPISIQKDMTATGLMVNDTDWYLRVLYDFALDQGCSILNPVFSRYVIDLNRDCSGKALYPGANNTELCPTTGFDCQPLYRVGKSPDAGEIARRIDASWRPYHHKIETEIKRLKSEFGKVLVLEAHSIASQVPRFFDGVLPDFNFGTNSGQSCGRQWEDFLEQFDPGRYSKVINARFKGGFITRHYADPSQNQHTIQLELSQRTYMNEPNAKFDKKLAFEVQQVLKRLINGLLDQF